MAVVSNGDSVDGVIRLTFSNGAIPVKRTSAFVADACDGNASDREMGSGDARDFATMAGGVVQTNDVGHGLDFARQRICAWRNADAGKEL